jgi:predicted  nucleic acid-binding Zn-ribbon protein
VTSAELQEFKQQFYAYQAYVQELRNELETARKEAASLRTQLAAKHEEITLLHERLRNRDVAGAVVGGNSIAEVDAARAKITELMREIDNCIALLNV